MRIYDKLINATTGLDADPVRSNGRYFLKSDGGQGVPEGNTDTGVFFRLMGDGNIGASVQSFQTAWENAGSEADVAVGDVVSLTASDGSAYGAVDANVSVVGRMGFALSNLAGTIHSFSARVIQ